MSYNVNSNFRTFAKGHAVLHESMPIANVIMFTP